MREKCPLVFWLFIFYPDYREEFIWEKQQKEKVQLPAVEQTQILKLLNDKIEALNLKAIEPTNDLEKLQQYLTEYSFNLKKHFYG